ncbi:amidase [Mesorhizobium liriopis]|uniref:amidase n=1 Tax=Mesorhizobium liriopis TaxID=2953882 RepID=UPI0025AFBB74|nr:amidase [Mesorhizobium liriopis]
MPRPSNKHGIASPSGPCALSATELVRAIRKGRFSVVEVTNSFLDRIEAANPHLNAVVSSRPREEVLGEAEAADRTLAQGAVPGALFGLPVAIKDLALTKGIRTTFGSPIFADHLPDEDEIFVSRMKAAGAIVVGKTNTPEWGLGSHTFNPVFGTTLNAFDPTLTAGGSSGGAAVAVALNMVPLADGSDFGGSLRNPAAFNNIYGMRPSQGVVPGGPSSELFITQMGVEGPMARTVADLALLLEVQAGYDPRAPLSFDLDDLSLDGAAKPWRIGWLGDLGGHLPFEAGVLSLCEDTLRLMETGPFTVEPCLPQFDFERLWQSFVTLRQATSGAALKPYRDDPAKAALLKPEAVWEAEGAARLSALDVYEASTTRSAWYLHMLELFERFDLIVLPTAQVFAFDANLRYPTEIAGRTMTSYHRWMEVVSYATLAGCPAVSVPAGFAPDGRAMGLQFIGRPRGDRDVLRAAAAWEAMCPWRTGAA